MSGKKIKTPELEKLRAVQDKSQAIGDFLEWLNSEKKVELAFYHKHGPSCDGWDRREEKIVYEYECEVPAHGRDTAEGHEFGMMGCHPEIVFGCTLPCQNLTPFRYTTTKLLAEYFEIDEDKCERERRAILDSLRS